MPEAESWLSCPGWGCREVEGSSGCAGGEEESLQVESQLGREIDGWVSFIGRTSGGRTALQADWHFKPILVFYVVSVATLTVLCHTESL